jgi:hypothetical protein
MSIPKRFYKFLLKRVLRDVLSTELEMDQFDVKLREGTLDLKDLNLKLDSINTWISSSNIHVTKGTIRQLKVNFSLTDGCCLEIRGLDLKTIASSETKREEKEEEDIVKEEELTSEEDEEMSVGLRSISSWLDNFISNILVRFVDTKISFENQVEIRIRLLEYLNEIPTRDESSVSLDESVVKVVRFRGLEVSVRDQDRLYPIVRTVDPEEKRDEMNAIRVSIPSDTKTPHIDMFIVSIDIMLSPIRQHVILSLLKLITHHQYCRNNSSTISTDDMLDESTRIESFVSCDSIDRTESVLPLQTRSTKKGGTGRSILTIKFRVLESRIQGYSRDNTTECMDMHAKHLELELEMFERGALRCNVDVENMYLNRVFSTTSTSRVVQFIEEQDESTSTSCIRIEMTRANRDSQLVLEVLFNREILVEFENHDTIAHFNELFSSLEGISTSSSSSSTTTTTKSIDISVQIPQLKLYLFDCMSFHIAKTMLFSPQRSNGPWILKARRVLGFETRSTNELVRLCSEQHNEDVITVSFMLCSSIACAWLHSKHSDDAENTSSYVRVSTSSKNETTNNHFEKLKSEIYDSNIRTAVFVHVKNGLMSFSQQSFARILNCLTSGHAAAGGGDDDDDDDDDHDGNNNTILGFCVRFDHLNFHIQENRPYTKKLGVPYEFQFHSRALSLKCIPVHGTCFLSARLGDLELSEIALERFEKMKSPRRILHKMQTLRDNRDIMIAQALLRSRVSSSSQEDRDILEIELCMSVRDVVLRHCIHSMWISQIIAWMDYTSAFLEADTGREASLKAADTVAPEEFSFGNTILNLSLDFENGAIRYLPSEMEMQAYLGVSKVRLTSNIVSYGLLSGFKVYFDDIELFVCPDTNEKDLKIGDSVAKGSLRESLVRAGFAPVASVKDNVVFFRFYLDDSMNLDKTWIDFEGGSLTLNLCADSFVLLRDCVSSCFVSPSEDDKEKEEVVKMLPEEKREEEVDIFENIDFDAFGYSDGDDEDVDDDKDSVEALLVEEYCCASKPPDLRVRDDGDWTLFDLVDEESLEKPVPLARGVSFESTKHSMEDLESQLRCGQSSSSSDFEIDSDSEEEEKEEEEEIGEEDEKNHSSSVMIETDEGGIVELRLDSSFHLRDDLAKIMMRNDDDNDDDDDVKDVEARKDKTCDAKWFDDVHIRPLHVERPSPPFDPQDMFCKTVSDASLQLTSRRLQVVVKIHAGMDWKTASSSYNGLHDDNKKNQTEEEVETTKEEEEYDHHRFNLNDALRESYYKVKKSTKQKKKNKKKKKTRQRRCKDDVLELVLEDLQFRTDIRDNAEHSSSSSNNTFRLAIKNIYVYDHLASSTVRTALSYWQDEQIHPRETNANMFRLFVRNASSELKIRVSVLPVRVNIDQEAVYTVARFLEHISTCLSDNNNKQQESDDVIFIQSININAIKIKLDYIPRRLPTMSQIREMQLLEILSVIPLEKMELVLCETQLDSISSIQRLISEIGSRWGNDVMRKQLHRCVAGVQAYVSFFSLSLPYMRIFHIHIHTRTKQSTHSNLD